MLLNKVRETNRLIELKYNSDRIKKQKNDYDVLNKRLDKIKITLSLYTDAINILNDTNRIYFPLENLTSIISKLNKFEVEFENGNIDNILLDTLTRDISRFENELHTKWDKYYENETTSLRNTILSIKNLVKDVGTAEIIINALNPNKSYWPINENKINIINNNIENGKLIINDLGLNKEIEAFLTLISENKATILDLKPEILEWIKVKNLQSKIGLKFK